jgi:serine/threonine protein kinase
MLEAEKELPNQLGPYRLGRRLGAGGMGEVYKATHIQLNRQVALKILRPSAARNETLFKRFQNEARAAAMPHHENIVIFYEYGSDQGFHYLAFERIKGTDLQQLIEKYGKLPIGFSLHVVKQIARALEHAHKHGFVHRDIKPSNILITKDKTVKLTDMGLARQLEELEDAKITRDGTTVGTVDYMAPEQAKDSHRADIRSDIYSLGCTWFHMLAGTPPYTGGNAMERVLKHLNAHVPDVRDFSPKVPEDMAFVIEKTMQKDPKNRYQTPMELLDELEHLKTTGSRTEFSGIAALAVAADEDVGTDDELPRTLGSSAPPAPLKRGRQVDPVWLFVGLGSTVLVVVLLVILAWSLFRPHGSPSSRAREVDDGGTEFEDVAEPRPAATQDAPAPSRTVNPPRITESRSTSVQSKPSTSIRKSTRAEGIEGRSYREQRAMPEPKAGTAETPDGSEPLPPAAASPELPAADAASAARKPGAGRVTDRSSGRDRRDR